MGRRPPQQPAASAFWPFVCSPTTGQQMSVLTGQFSGPAEEAMFIQTLFAGSDGRQAGDISIRVFEFGRRILFATIFTTDAIEPTTKRSGLKIAIGFAISDHLYLLDSRLPRVLGGQLWDLLNNSFGTSLPHDGARDLIEHFVAGGDTAALSAIEQQLQQASDIVTALKLARFGAIGRTLRRWGWRLRRVSKSPPKCLLILDDQCGAAINAAFAALVFEHIERARGVGEGANLAGSHGRDEVIIRYLDVGTARVRGSALVRARGLTYVALY